MGETIATNKKAFRDYHFLQNWECGLVLKGCEVKSLRAGEVSFTASFARVDEGEVFLFNLHISPYQQASYMNEEPDRPRKLLLQKKELKKIIGLMTQRGFTLIPTKIYFNNRGFAKVDVALAKGKKQYDKRDDLKARDTNREISRAIRQKR